MTLTGRSGTVSRTASATNASVPSEPDEEVREDVDRALEVEERVQRVAGRVLRPVLRADARGEGGVGDDARAQVDEALPERRLLRAEDVVRVGARRVDRRAGREQERERLERVVRVLRDAAAHPARVVREDAAERARGDGGGVGPDLPSERAERAVRVRADDARLDADPRAAVLDGQAAEAPRRLDEDAVRDGLAREARPGRAEDERDAVGVRDGEEAPDLVRALRVDDGLRARGGRSSRRTPTRSGRSRA